MVQTPGAKCGDSDMSTRGSAPDVRHPGGWNGGSEQALDVRHPGGWKCGPGQALDVRHLGGRKRRPRTGAGCEISG